MPLKKALYIDALSLVPARKSGIGYTLEKTLEELTLLPEIVDQYIVYLVVPLWKAKYLEQYKSPLVKIKTIYLPARILEVFLRTNICPPIDWLVGRGVYLFPNYRNWPLWRSRSLTYVYDVSFLRFPKLVKPNNQRYLSRYIQRWVKRTDMVLTITDEMKEDIEKTTNISYAKIEVVPCGVDKSVFYRRSKAEVNATKKSCDVPFADYFLFVGNIEPRKNLMILLDAYQALPAKLRASHGLVFVGGDGWLSDDFNERLRAMQAAGENVLKIKKYVDTSELPALYSGATALVHPAVYEGFGITPLEAMACGTPAITSDIAAIREVAQGAALYVDPADSKQLSDALVTIVHNKQLASELVEEGYRRTEQYSWYRAAIRLLTAIDRQQAEAVHKFTPIIKRLKALYIVIDTSLRSLFGEKALKPYRPKLATTQQAIIDQVYSDFLNEQPSKMQVRALHTYQAVKHRAAKGIRFALRSMRGA